MVTTLINPPVVQQLQEAQVDPFYLGNPGREELSQQIIHKISNTLLNASDANTVQLITIQLIKYN